MGIENLMRGRVLFISYSRRNRDDVYRFVDALRRADVSVWIDLQDIDPLDEFPSRIRDGIAGAHALLAWYSKEYAQSTYCQRELTAAWIAAAGLTRHVASRILIVNPETDVQHIALGDLGTQNFLPAPNDAATQARCVSVIVDKLGALAAGDGSSLAAILRFRPPAWSPQPRRIGSSRFVGRLHELWRIHTGLVPLAISGHEAAQALVQVNGIGGAGKTLLAIAYADRFGAAFPRGVFWLRGNGSLASRDIDATGRRAEFERQVEAIAGELGVQTAGIPFGATRRLLAERLGAEKDRYLWIIDDLPAGLVWDELEAWCAPTANGSTLLVTRSTQYEGLGRQVPLGPLGVHDALALLTAVRQPATLQDDADARQLCVQLGYHPQALDVAGGLLSSMSVAQLRAELDDPALDPLGQVAASLRGQLPGGHERSVVATLLLSIRALGDGGHDLLRLDGVLRVATPLSRRLAERALGPLNGRLGRHAQHFVQIAAEQLLSQSLATLSIAGTDQDYVLVHAMARYTMLRADPLAGEAASRRRALREAAVWALIDSLGGDGSAAWQPWREPEVAQARHLALDPRSAHEAVLCTRVAAASAERGDLADAIRLARRALAVLGSTLGEDHPVTLSLRNDLALWTAESGHWKRALVSWQELLLVEERVLAQDDRLLLRTRQNIALWTGLSGNAAAARSQLEALYDRARRSIGEHDVDTLTIRHNMIHWIGWAGDAAQAARLMRELVADARAMLSPEDPLLRDARFNLAHWDGESGHAASARAEFQRMLDEAAPVFGPRHPFLLDVRHQLARWTAMLGDLADATDQFAAVLSDSSEILGPDHPNTLAVEFQLASWVAQAGDVCGARTRFADLSVRQRATLGLRHPGTLLTRASLAGCQATAGQRAPALRRLVALQPQFELAFGARHPHVRTLDGYVAALKRAEQRAPAPTLPNFARWGHKHAAGQALRTGR